MTRIKSIIVSLQVDLQQIPNYISLSLLEIIRSKNIFIDRNTTVVHQSNIINRIDRYRPFGCKQMSGSGIIEILCGNTDK